MNWFLSIISQKPFLEMEVENLLRIHPRTKNTIIKPAFYFAFDALPQQLYQKTPTKDDPTLKLVIGRGYLSKGTGYSQADGGDWDNLLRGDYTPADIDGHFVAMRVNEESLQATSDIFGHCAVYYAQEAGYCIVSNQQHLVARLLEHLQWNNGSIAALALLPTPLARQSFLANISLLPAGMTLNLKNNKFSISGRVINTNIDDLFDVSTDKYFFSLKKAYELQLNPSDFISIPFETTSSSRFAISVWSSKAKKYWGLYHSCDADELPEDHLDPFMLSNLKIAVVPDIADPDEIWGLYRDYVLSTGLADFPSLFSLAGTIREDPAKHTINLLTSQAEWLFEQNPMQRIDRLYRTIAENKYLDFKKLFISSNELWDDEFYAFLLRCIETYFKQIVDTYAPPDPAKGKALPPLNAVQGGVGWGGATSFYIHNHLTLYHAPQIAWLNQFRTFYSPATLYSLVCMHIAQREKYKDPKGTNIGTLSDELYKNLADERFTFPEIYTDKWTIPQYPHQNQQYFPYIAEKINELIAKAEKIPYYKLKNLQKIYKKALKGNASAINTILRWTAFEIWRGYVE